MTMETKNLQKKKESVMENREGGWRVGNLSDEFCALGGFGAIDKNKKLEL